MRYGSEPLRSVGRRNELSSSTQILDIQALRPLIAKDLSNW